MTRRDVRTDGPRVLLLWPGGLLRRGANFGVPQLLSMAGVLRREAGARVEVIDLDMERAFGPVDLRRMARRGYDLVGISCYSSYDYLKVMVIASSLRQKLPQACFVVGGYHPSAVPDDFTREDSPFDYVIVGDGERSLLELVQQLGRGQRPNEPVRRPNPVDHLDELPPYDWSLLERYRPVARQRASQAEIYLARGCPLGCSFCMEGAKGASRWRAFEPGRAVEELHRLDDFLDLTQWTLFIADAVFGLQASWRRAFLEQLVAAPIRARKIWLLTRADGLERVDLELMARANAAPGFGLESGDATMLARIRKSPHPEEYLARMLTVARHARELRVPFGANVIVGHPGETEPSLRASAAYLRRLFVEQQGATTGFLSVDPFRLYPGSAVANRRAHWERETGMKAHRYPWWHDGDQDFLAEWVTPSAELSFRRTLALRRELFDPLLAEMAGQFAYLGPAADYFQRALDEQLRLTRARHYLHVLGMWHLWRGLSQAEADSPAPPDEGPLGVADDEELRALSRTARADTLRRSRWSASEPVLEALREVPRERFVRLAEMGSAADDCALGLTDDDASTLSALHAYAEAFTALRLEPGDSLVELGSGNGYGAMLASEVVGSYGQVLTLEIREDLAARAAAHLAGYAQARVLCADAHETEHWQGAQKVYVAFAVVALPAAWLDALAEGGRLVAPVGPPDEQRLVLVEKEPGAIRSTELGPVRYVPDRSG